MDADLTVRFDGIDALSFVAGEDRTIAVTLADANTGLPVGLTGAVVSVNLPGSGGQAIKRSNQTYTLGPASVSFASAPGTLTLGDHGMVTGDPLVFVGTALPAPLVAGQTYYATFVDPNTISLQDVSANPVVLTSGGSASFTLQNPSDVGISPTVTGLATLALRAATTLQVQTGIGQNLEVMLVSGGKTRIVAMMGSLDVVAQYNP